MSKLVWDQVGTRKYEVGVDHGVLYQKVGNEFVDGVAWNGLVDVTTDTESTASNLYSGDVKADIAQGNDEISGTITAYTYPDEFEACIGAASAIPGFIVRQQAKNYFGISYRTLLGNDVKGQEYGYRIHLIYNAIVLSESHTHSTISDSTDGLDMSWDFDTIPMLSEDEDYYPYSELLFDSTRFSSEFMAALENILYGTDTESPRMPDLDELIDLYTEEEPMPTDWTGLPNELLYPSDTLYPQDWSTTTISGLGFPPGVLNPNAHLTSLVAQPGSHLIPLDAIGVNVTFEGIPEELSVLTVTYEFTEDRSQFNLTLTNETEDPVTISDTLTVVATVRYMLT